MGAAEVECPFILLQRKESLMPRQIFDLSHEIEDGLITYKGLPAPVICDFLSRENSRQLYAPGTEFHIGRIDMVANTGTYVDSPFHRFPDGKDLSELPIESLADLPGVLIDARGRRRIDVDILRDKDEIELRGTAVLFLTEWSENWKQEKYFSGLHPFLSAELAGELVKRQVSLVGIDSYNIDDTSDNRRPVHTILLGNDIPIVEHMTGLATLPGHDFRFSAVPVKIRKFGTFPVRAYAVVTSP